MITRRNYISITILMLSLLVLCMSINHLKDNLNDYAVNQYTETAENYPSKTNIFIPDSAGDPKPEDPELAAEGEESAVPRNFVVCIGDRDAPSMQIAAEWAAYTKRRLAVYPTVSACQAAGPAEALPEMLVIDPACVDWNEADLDFLDECLAQEISVVFCGMPEVPIVQGSERVRALFGIRSVAAEEAEVDGFYLRDGFLLGGTAFYLETDEEDPGHPLAGSSAFPLERSLPWYLPAAGTKVYMTGVPKEDTAGTRNAPIVIWRNRRENGFVFAVNGDLMQGWAAFGLLSAMSAEMHDYELYPVVNAQNMVLTGYPCLADENQAQMQQLYSRPLRQVHRELMWPGISQLLEQYGYRATCMLAPQYDYADGLLPDGGLLEAYLKMFAENSAETGLYGLNVSGTPLPEKLAADGRFFEDALGGYDIVSFYAGGLTEQQLGEALDADVLSSTRTVVQNGSGPLPGPVGFLTEDVTVQSALSDGLEYTYQSDLLIRSIQTALGYLSMSFDLSRVAWPDGDEAAWQQLSEVMGATVSTYGQQYPAFARTTAAECDARIRRFLAMDYSEVRTGSQLRIRVKNSTDTVWFILRTHNEAIREADGCSWVQLEQDAYLIGVAGENAVAVLTLGPADERHYQ